MESKDVSNKTKELLGKSRLPLCQRCHKVFNNITRHIIQLLKDSQIPDIPPDEFINILRGTDAKYGCSKSSDPRWKWIYQEYIITKNGTYDFLRDDFIEDFHVFQKTSKKEGTTIIPFVASSISV